MHILLKVIIFWLRILTASYSGAFMVQETNNYNHRVGIIESVDSISRDEPDSPLMQYITNAGISRTRYTITHFKHHHRVLRLISNQISI